MRVLVTGADGFIGSYLTEMLSAHSSPDIVQKFGLKNLLAAAGKSVEGLEDEHLESDVHGADESYGSRVVEELAAFWKPLVYPDFDIQFNIGKGDIWRRLRLVPLTKGGTTDLVKGGDLGKSATQKIVDNYDQLVDHLRGVSF